jgi:hypothetical protein
MQFGLFGLMLMAPAAGLGCLGWRIGAWMATDDAQFDVIVGISVVMLATTAIALLIAIVLSGRPAFLLALLGCFANVCVMFGTMRLPRASVFDLALFIAVSATCLPLAAVGATVANAWREPNKLNCVLLIVPCLSAGWVLCLLWMSDRY